MLMALHFEPSRFFLKSKVRQKKTSYIHKHTVKRGISHLTNFLSYSRPTYVYVCSFFLSHLVFEKEPARFETWGQ